MNCAKCFGFVVAMITSDADDPNESACAVEDHIHVDSF